MTNQMKVLVSPVKKQQLFLITTNDTEGAKDNELHVCVASELIVSRKLQLYETGNGASRGWRLGLLSYVAHL